MIKHKDIIKGFDPIYTNDSKVLILGSFPSVLSFENNFYYGNPRNHFWYLMNEIFDERINTVEDKKKILIKHNIALWDIVASGENNKKGKQSSSDSNLSCIVPADIRWIIGQTKIDKILCNGKKSFSLLEKYFPDLAQIAYTMPSTSPANFNFNKQVWIEQLKEYR